MDKIGNWKLSPAYSFNPRGDWPNKHQMSINGKRDDFIIKDLVELGIKADLSELKSKNIIKETLKVVKNWKKYFEECKVPENIIEGIDGNLRLNLT